MNRFRDRIASFMAGRNGVDQLSRFLYIVALIFMIVSLFIPKTIPRNIVWGVGMAILAYSLFRVFSKNYPARNRENQWFWFLIHGKKYDKKAMDKKTHKIFKCPNCKQKIRVPKKKGKICITCPKCRNEFIKRT